jgi:hypothetical protein
LPFIGENLKTGDTITINSTKWRKEPLEIKQKDGLVFPTKEPYSSFFLAPILLAVVSFILLSPNNKPPRKNEDRRVQKNLRVYYLIVNFLCSIVVFFILYMSVKNLF